MRRTLALPARFLGTFALAVLASCGAPGEVASPTAPGPPPEVPSGSGIEEPTAGSVTTGTQQSSSMRAVATASFSEPWGCGWGFYATTADRTAALELSNEGALPPPGPMTVTLPDPAWRAEVHLGRNLLTVDCAGQDLMRNPAPTEIWRVEGGTLEIDVPEFGGCGVPTAARAIARNLTVRAPDGGSVTFAELQLTNDEWGCFAG